MGTTTFYLKKNDLSTSLDKLNKKEIKQLANLSPHGKENDYIGWSTPMELHNGNIYLLVFWRGQLMKLEEAPEILKDKYYNRFTGKTMNIYEWTLLKRLMLNEIRQLDHEFKKKVKKKK